MSLPMVTHSELVPSRRGAYWRLTLDCGHEINYPVRCLVGHSRIDVLSAVDVKPPPSRVNGCMKCFIEARSNYVSSEGRPSRYHV